MCLGIVPLLASCALAPGMRFDPQRPLDPEDPQSVPKVTQITPALVRTLKAATPAANAGVEALFGEPGPYTVGVGDILSIVVWDHPELVFPTQTYSIGAAYEIPSYSGAANIPGYVVSPAGTIQFPYAGVLKVLGQTPDQIRGQLSTQLKPVVTMPQVTVRVLAFRSKRVYLDGEVKTPGPQNIDDVPMTLVEALNRAGGINVLTGDNSRIRISREGKIYYVSLPALLQQGIDPARILLRNGDIVRVEQREDSKVFVTGEVVKPTPVMPRNGRLTLSEAIGEAGGLNPNSANAKELYVIRKADDGQAEVFHLDGKSPVAFALAEAFELKPRDVVYVDAAGVVRWSRVINQLVPSGNFFTSTANAVK
ncbi:polysaccharide export outer membrane protein epsA precursor (EPS I polysaccharide export system) [Cupriavidus taiwanensis]|uniref:Polysaccharide export outer membrane protein epsA (EPS I polysaccharide export system) n=2 Tax=Cupriavidus taiwanensis TaxID=164546 RepID=A0A375IYM5_9BURK|nr:polysaccharide export outer membrane protein epsA precursor (EPS I polysaccharide export system) [Cupriavidus taiwanensis]SOZ21818.1 polysaccharide export outer membrane protein epsA precursor (EPS I polysaccharide export system) [Cupriavidus taiwanensis]SOZ41743.1 polysaccharide export outer membrane protein epsA precursor (EPS I polysaccharide export system) [Cupriavidus taiwanensis]SPR96670.1 polysaccharide export outer membrane protein epsA precursor (EPS I polysaccharide export system) [